ncbi:MAG: HlyD family efflux transporter periplasmic adaptor subunit [Gammaproteobacteria bacterium]|nr:HlyD family efflux transporter periplasmic adaptor subunit [Gammaproteobacteria bacterium]
MSVMRKSFLLAALIAGGLGYWTLSSSREGSDHLNGMHHSPDHSSGHAMHTDAPMAPGAGPATQRFALPVVMISPDVVHNLGVRTARVRYGDLVHRIETIGKITRVDPMARRTLTPPIRGELVRIADKQEGDMVKAGEFLFSVRSDELFEHEKAFRETYLAGDRATANAMIPGLNQMGLSPDQIARLQSGDAPEMPVEVRAFEDGFIYTRRGLPGDKVHTGFTVFNVGGNYRVIEVTAEIFERQWRWVKQDQQASMTVRGLPGTVFEGRVVRVEPPVGYTTRSLEVALKFRTDNPELSQSMFAHVNIIGQGRKHVLLVPSDSVIRTGEGDRVIVVEDGSRFSPVAVVAGEEGRGMTEILSRLNEGDEVVASGQFLIDSESKLLAGLQRHGAHMSHHHGASKPGSPSGAHHGHAETTSGLPDGTRSGP